MPSTISVVVPVFNRAQLVLATLETVAGQTRPPARLVVVDDGSTDHTAAQVAAWLDSHKHLFDCRLLRQTNRGPATARNRGLAAARPCSLVAFLDSDDRWPNDFLERAAGLLESRPAAVAATCDRAIVKGTHTLPRTEDLSPLSTAPLLWMLKHGAALASATLFRTAAIDAHGGFDETVSGGHDIGLFMPLSLDGPWLHVPGRPVLFNHAVFHGGDQEGNLGRKYGDNFRRRAQAYEQFMLNGGGHRAVASEKYRPLLGKAWYRAGRELAGHGMFVEARECYQIALGWHRRSYVAWQWLALDGVAAQMARLLPSRRRSISGPMLADLEDTAFLQTYSTSTVEFPARGRRAA